MTSSPRTAAADLQAFQFSLLFDSVLGTKVSPSGIYYVFGLKTSSSELRSSLRGRWLHLVTLALGSQAFRGLSGGLGGPLSPRQRWPGWARTPRVSAQVEGRGCDCIVLAGLRQRRARTSASR